MTLDRVTPRVHLLCGLNGAGKTTYARALEADLPAVRFTLDEWMLRLHDLPFDDKDYPERAETCRLLIRDVAVQVLRSGTDVVLDWNRWSRRRRQQWHARAEAAGRPVLVHYVRVPLDTAVARAAERARQPGCPRLRRRRRPAPRLDLRGADRGRRNRDAGRRRLTAAGAVGRCSRR